MGIDRRASWRPRISPGDYPAYLALAQALERDLASGQVAPGERLPPQRALAQALGLDVTTISRAYGEARRRGLIVGQVGRGTYVRTTPLRPAGSLSAGAAPIDLRTNYPPEPCATCEAAYRRSFAALARDPVLQPMTGYAPLGGTEEHREAGVRWCRAWGMAATADRVLVCASAQEGLLAVLGALCEPGDTVLTEELTYPGLIAAAELLRLRLLGVRCDRDGPLPDAVEAACRQSRPKVLCVTTTLHNPTGIVVPLARRRQIAAVVRKQGLQILEDDAYGSLLPKVAQPLAGFAPECSFYLASLSKSVSPGLRTAFLAVPHEAKDRILTRLRATGWMAASPLITVAARWIMDGTAEEIVASRRREAQARQNLAWRFLGPWPGGSRHGYHLWVSIPPRWRPASLFETLERRGVRVAMGETFAVNPAARVPGLRLALGAPQDWTRLEHALRVIAEVMSGEHSSGRPTL